MIDTLEAEAFGPLSEQPLLLIDVGDPAALAWATEVAGSTDAVVVGLDQPGALPAIDPAPFDTLLTTSPAPPRPWVGVAAQRWGQRLTAISAAVARAPFASGVAMKVLRIGSTLGFEDALHVESLGYSTLLGGQAFRTWRDARARQTPARDDTPAVAMARDGDLVSVELARPGTRNAICASMRDGLFEALAAVLDDPSAPSLRLSGQGACFSTGGDLAEFGSAGDLALAHAIRTCRSCALLLHRLGTRAEVILHGACIGSGIEIPAAAARRVGKPNAFFQLPELGMGLIPGAGGTVTLPRVIGRHRTAAMLLSGRRIDAATALDWGLLTSLDAA